MRLLLISDTHGQLDIINELAAQTQADAVIHAGDFGFYDYESYDRLSERELRLQIIHCWLPKTEKTRIIALPRSERNVAAKAAGVLGQFQSYIDGNKSFHVPVYAVWGNHEDKSVIQRLIRGNIKLRNLYILHHRQTYEVGPLLIYGLGGNFLKSKLLQKPLAGGGGRIWTVLSQYADVVRAVDEINWSGLRLFVSHVSPGKEPFVELIGARTQADFTVSGHMGAPTCMVWNPFAICSVEESIKRLQDGLESIRQACLSAIKRSTGQTTNEIDWVRQTLSFIGQLPEENIYIGRGARVPRWYRDMVHINLPHVHRGYAVLDIINNRTGPGLQTNLQTFVAQVQSNWDKSRKPGSTQIYYDADCES